MLIAADNLTASRPEVRKALDSRDAGFISNVCASAQRAGAAWLDLNPGFVPSVKREEVWRFLVQTAEEACGLKLMLDAPDVDSLAVAVDFCTRPPVINMATAEPARLGPVLDIAAAHDLEVVAALMTSMVPLGTDERLGLAAMISAEAHARSITGSRLILDPMVMPLALPGGEAHAHAVIEVLRALPHLFEEPPQRLIALSNLYTRTAGADARAAAEPYLAAAWGAGLEIVMLNAADKRLMEASRLLGVFEGKRIFAPGEYI